MMKIHQQRQRHQDRSGNVTSPRYAEMENEKAADPEPRVACLLHSHVPCDATNGLALSEAQGMEGYFDSEFVAVCQVDCPPPLPGLPSPPPRHDVLRAPVDVQIHFPSKYLLSI